MWVCAWAAPSGWHSSSRLRRLPAAGLPRNLSLCSWEAERVASLAVRERGSGLLTLLPHPACCAHEGLELHNLFQYRGKNLSVRQGDHGPLGVLIFVLHHARET